MALRASAPALERGGVTLASAAIGLLVAQTGPVDGARLVIEHSACAHAARLEQAIVVDGRLDEPVWRGARPITSFVQRDPIQGAAPTERTEVLIAFDDKALYVGAQLYDSAPGAIVSRLARRDSDVTADGFVVYLDTRHDRRTGVYFALSVAGTHYDGTLSNDDWQDSSWDPVWEGATLVGPDRWTVEMRIPLSQLRFEREDGGIWGINFERIIARKNEHDLLVYTPRHGSGFVSRFPALEVGAISPARRLELLPYVSARSDYFNHTVVSALDDQRTPLVRVGGDLKLGLGGNVTIDGTIFPDFGQVEVDPAVVNLTDSEVFFPERRPFFIEGADIFGAFGRGGARDSWNFNWPGSDLLYSRRIGRPPQGTVPDHDAVAAPAATDILGAVKLTGKVGGWTVGTLHALTEREETRYLAGGVESRVPVEPFTYYGLARVQREIDGGRHGLGLMATLTARRLDDANLAEQLNASAAVGGVDGWTQLGPTRMWAVHGWAAFSRLEGSPVRMTALQKSSAHYFQRPDAGYLRLDPGATRLSGWAGRLALNKQHGNILMNVGVGALSPGWDVNDLGFSARADLINAHVGGGYQWLDPGRVFRTIKLMAATFSNWDFGGNQTTQGFWADLNPQLLDYWWARLSMDYTLPALDDRATRGGPLMRSPGAAGLTAAFDSDDRRRWRVGTNWRISRSDADPAWSWSGSGYVDLRPWDRIVFRVDPSYEVRRTDLQYLDTLADPTATATYGNRYLFGGLHQKTLSAAVRLSWIFSPTLSLELFGQPLVSSVRYADVHQLARPRSNAFIATELDPAKYTFTFTSVRSSAVLRWEYLPGSTLFVVWNQNHSLKETDGRFHPGRSFQALADSRADHVFMVKASYWWSP
jgi:hypothetical protein